MKRLALLAVVTVLVPLSPLCAQRGSWSPPSLPADPDTGSDAWGYTWFRSDEPGGPTFNWVDITSRGTLVTGLGDDNFVGPFQMQFAFPFYWYTVSGFYVGSNGFICFSGPTNFASPFVQLPNTSGTTPKDLLAICVGDLDFTSTGSNPECYYWTNSIDSLVVSFINVTEWQQVPNPNLKHTFQIILNRRDSSITYQYGVQQGRYNSPNNTYLCIGWQNQTGQIGRSYTYSSTPPHALMPDSGLAIRIRRVWEEVWYIYDARMIGGFDSDNLAKVMRTGVADTIRCMVKNQGNMALTDVRVRYAITKSGQPSAYDTVMVPTLAVEEQRTVTFPRLFAPAAAGTYSALFNVTISNDWTPSNNTKTAEIYSAAFGVGQSTLIRFEDGMDNPSIWWDGNGYAIAIDLPPEVYPVRVESVYVKIGAIMNQPMVAQILDGSTGSPGAVLAERTVAATAVAMNAVDFTLDNVVITGGRFFVAALGYMEFMYETASPISCRAWEYVNGWRPYQSRDIRDMIIRASVRGVTTDVEQLSSAIPHGFILEQNYPNPFNPSTQIKFDLPEASTVSLTVYDVLGRQVVELATSYNEAGHHSVTWNASNQASGVYFARFSATDASGNLKYTKVNKLVLMK